MAVTLNIIGGGKLGKTLAKLWHHGQHFCIQQIMTSREKSAREAIHFTQCGEAVWHTAQLQPARVWLLATADEALKPIAQDLAKAQLIQPGNVVFHCSGALSSLVLSPLHDQGAHTASIHPIHSFAHPDRSVCSFRGTACVYEGENSALELLLPAFTAIGANLISIAKDKKSLYHIGSVLACNYLIPLLNASLRCFKQAGIETNQAAQCLSPLLHHTIDNMLQTSAPQALTGPISRGDYQTIKQHCDCLKTQAPDLLDLYCQLGLKTIEVARQQKTSSGTLLNIEQLFTQYLTKTSSKA